MTEWYIFGWTFIAMLVILAGMHIWDMYDEHV